MVANLQPVFSYLRGRDVAEFETSNVVLIECGLLFLEEGLARKG